MPQSIENKTTSNSLHVTLTDRHSRSDSRCNRREVLKLHELKAVVEKAIQVCSIFQLKMLNITKKIE